MTTKEQERKVLARIKKMVESLGEDSYIGTAFEGCFEIAEENIEDDVVCSMKQRYENASEDAARYNATDWNYIRFDCGSMEYELDNGNLRFYIH